VLPGPPSASGGHATAPLLDACIRGKDPEYASHAAARQGGSESRFVLIDDTDLAGTIQYNGPPDATRTVIRAFAAIVVKLPLKLKKRKDGRQG
jgi:hypothetical protein